MPACPTNDLSALKSITTPQLDNSLNQGKGTKMKMFSYLLLSAALGLFCAQSWAQTADHDHQGHDHATHDHQGHDHSGHNHGDGSGLNDEDQLHAVIQQICPVSGGKLGSMGAPIKTQVEGQTIFLCCKGCEGKQFNQQHWTTIQNNFAKAQGTCPIMGKPVTGASKSTVLNGHRIFICCPPCAKKIQADPDTALKKVHAAYVAFANKGKGGGMDQAMIAAQKICPVSGQKLGAMGAPIKVKVGEEEVFLCCKGCTKKQINPQHWATVQANLAAAQKVCPVMGKPVDGSMKSTVINGHRVFVCCPGCIEKIQANADKVTEWLGAQYSKSMGQN